MKWKVWAIAISLITIVALQVARAEQVQDEQIPLTFSAPFPTSPFEVTYKHCIEVLESIKSFAQSSQNHPQCAHALVDRSVALYKI